MGAPVEHAFSVTVAVPPGWVHHVTQTPALFSASSCAGRWACGMAHNPGLGWLVVEFSEDNGHGFPEDDAEVTVRAKASWRAGEELPPGWYRLDAAAALRMIEEGAKRYGVGWYGSSAHDGAMEDAILQATLLGELRYD